MEVVAAEDTAFVVGKSVAEKVAELVNTVDTDSDCGGRFHQCQNFSVMTSASPSKGALVGQVGADLQYFLRCLQTKHTLPIFVWNYFLEIVCV